MNKNLVIVGDIIKFYPYRHALTHNWVCEVYMEHDDYQYLRRKLQKAGYDMDNHIVFSTEKCNFWLSDNWLHIGGEVVERTY